MIKQALREALLDLKGQMRSRRASSYLKKEEDRHEKKEKELGGEEDDSESIVDSIMGDSEDSREGGEDSSMGDKGLDPELKAEMSQFMSKRRKGSTKGGPSKSIFMAMDMPKPKAMKGKK